MELKPIPGPRPGRLGRRPAPPDARLAQEFTGRQTNRAGVDSAMRVLSQPVYRYEGTKGDVIDGGLFVFVHGGAPRSSC